MALLSRARRALPAPRVEPSYARSLDLPATEQRWLLAVVHLELTLSSWGVPTHIARHWLHGAQAQMERPEPLVLTLELDPLADLVTIELLTGSGDRVFGIDAYLRAPELH